MSRQQVIIPGDGLANQFSLPTTVWASDINPVLEQSTLRAGIPYYSPMHTMNYQGGNYGVPYWMQGIAMQTCNVLTITAPEPFLASWITHPANDPGQKGVTAFGQAPTSGIYTGMHVAEDHC